MSSPSYHPSQALSPEAYQEFQAAASQLQGERRNVVVLFADLCDYTELSSQMDPEEVFSFVNRYLAVLIEQVYKYEGVIDKFTGDGIMALFGAPLAHENDAERAVRACIEMQKELQWLNEELASEMGVTVKARLGVHYGAVVFGQVGINLSNAVSVMDYTVIGDTVNLASRLEQAAEPGRILVSQAVYEQTKALIEYETIPPLALKGLSKPVSAYYVSALKRQPGRVRGLEGRQTPLIGRETEFGLVSESVDLLRAGNTGQVVLVTGEGGIGKSRLTAELKKRLDVHDIGVLEGGSLSYRRSISYWTFREILSRYFDLQQEDSPERRRLKIRCQLEKLDSHLLDAAPFIEQVLSISPADRVTERRIQQLEPEQLQQQTFVALRDLFQAEATRRPLVLILEDLHWADRLTIELIKFLMDLVHQVPLMLYCISRPVEGGSAELLADYAQARFSEQYLPIPLQPLSVSQSDQLLRSLLTVPNLPKTLHATISQRAEGNPFYLEETIRMLIGEGIIHQVGDRWELVPGAEFSQLDVPDTLQGLVMARFDRQPDDLRELLQMAAVIGFQFSYRLISAVASSSRLRDQLAHLEAEEFIVRQDDESDTIYVFQHVITADTIYGSILKRQREVVHGQVAQAIERLYRHRLGEVVEMLASHYAKSRYEERALYYLAWAGQNAARSFANSEALDFFEQALALIPRVGGDTQQQLDILQGMGDVLSFIGEYQSARERYQQAAEFLRVHWGGESNWRLGVAERKIANTFVKQGDYDQALIYLAAALRRIKPRQAGQLKEEYAWICQDIGWVHLRRANLEQAKTWLQRGLVVADVSNQRQLVASIYNRLGGVCYQDGDWQEAARWLGKSLEIQQQMGDLAGMARSHNNLGVMAGSQSELNNARQHFERSLELRLRIGDTEGVLSNYQNLGAMLITMGDLDAARDALDKALEIADRIGHSFVKAMVHLNQGRLAIYMQNWDAAIESLGQSVAVFTEIGAQDDLINAYFYLGEACLGMREMDSADKWLQKAMGLCDQMGSRALSKSLERARCFRLQGALARELQDWQVAQELLRECMAICQALGNQFELARALYEFGVLRHRLGDFSSAVEHLSQAREIFDELGSRLELARTQQALARTQQALVRTE